jgi:carboxymethylenebutenolidase
MAGVTDDDHLALLGAAADLLEERGIGPIGVLGFCMGGMYALKAAALGGTPVAGRFDRAVSFYGMIRVPEAWRGPGQRDAVDLIRDEGACPVLAVIGTLDAFTPPVDVDDLEATGATVLRYEGAEHGFVHDASRPAHRPDEAADAWRRAAEFLAV